MLSTGLHARCQKQDSPYKECHVDQTAQHFPREIFFHGLLASVKELDLKPR